jgi:Ca-activated chloride channel family protein
LAVAFLTWTITAQRSSLPKKLRCASLQAGGFGGIVYALEYPWLLWLLPLPLLVWLLIPSYKDEQTSVRIPFFDRVAAAAGLKPAPGAIVPRRNWLQKILAPLCWCLTLIALARPVSIEPPISKIEPARDLMLGLDISQSMETPDFISPEGRRITRINAVKRVVDGFIQHRIGDRIGLIVFGAAPYPQSPFTRDHSTCRALLAETQAGMAGPQTMIGDAIGLAIKEFENSEVKEKVLILLTDGNDTGSRMPPLKAAEIAKDHGVKIHTVVIGNPKATGEDKVDVGLMRSVAEKTGGRFFLGQDQKQLAEIYATLDRITPQNFKSQTYRPKHQLFLYPLLAALLLLIAYQLTMFTWTLLKSLRARQRAYFSEGQAGGLPHV